MPLNRFRQALLFTAALLLAVPAAHARKDDEDRGRRDEREQQYEQRRDADNGRYRPQGDDRRGRIQEPRRYEQRELRSRPEYTEPRGRSQPRIYDNPRPQRDDPYDAPRSRSYEAQPRYAPRGLSMSEAVSQAERRTGGRVLSAEPGDDGGQPYYRIKVLSPNGRVQVLHFDAR